MLRGEGSEKVKKNYNSNIVNEAQECKKWFSTQENVVEFVLSWLDF